MNNSSFITIAEPCHEGWQNMDVSEKGRFCLSCKKHVHDFSSSSIDEIKAVYRENNGDLCGHVPANTLNGQYMLNQLQKNHYSYLRTFCIAVLFCFGANLFSINSSKAGALQKLKMSFFNRATENSKDSISVKGFIRNKDSHAIVPFATIKVTHNDSLICSTTANINGEYELKIPKNKYAKVDITASYYGYEPHTMKNISIAGDKKVEVDIDIEYDDVILDGMMIMSHEPDPVVPKGK